MKAQTGSREINEIATAVPWSIADIDPSRNELAIYGGAIHFSKETIKTGEFTHFGFPAKSVQNGWKIYDTETYLKSVSQEHGLIKCSSKAIREFSVGDVITILPVHSCLTANLMGTYTLSDGRYPI
jgi:D-serine deaminase-like pyridoxal phosphate-dependent protein